MNDNARLVYSTENGKICPKCGQGQSACRCRRKRKARETQAGPIKSDGIVRIQKEVKGRKGKCASVIYGLDPQDERLEQIARDLKNSCATGGSVKAGVIIIQGDHREKIRQILQGLGYTVKLAGG